MGMFLILVGAVMALSIYVAMKLLERKKVWWPNRGVPNYELPSFYSRISQKSTFLQTDEKLYKQNPTSAYGGYMDMFKPILFVRDLELAKNIQVKDFDHFFNRRPFNAEDANWNDMLVNKRGGDWKDLRAKMSPTFSTGKIRKMFPIMNDSSKKLISHLEELTTKNEGVVDFEDALGRYAMDVISSAAFGVESQIFRDKDSIVSKMAKRLQLKVNPWFMFRFALSMIHSSVSKLINFKIIDKEGGAFFDKIIKDSIRQREMSEEKRNDFLQLMIDVKHGQLMTDKTESEEGIIDTYEKDAQLTEDEGKKNTVAITDDLIVANCILFIFGGFDTTQSALVFGAYALAVNPYLQETLRRELQDATQHNGGELNYDVVNQSEYLDKFVNEVLRMYPPAIRTERLCTKDYALPNGTVIPKDSLIAIPVYQIHHDEKYFPNPEVFDPERFSPEVKASRHPYAFMPFGHGPRNCIAMRFALTETKAALANLVMNFEIEPSAKTTIPMVFSKQGNLKPINGMWLKFKQIGK